MTIRDLKGKVNDRIPVKNVLLSVYDKSGLDVLTTGLFEACPDIRFMSTGGTYKKLSERFASSGSQSRLIEVAQYTGFPEMEGGLVKTLHPKIHAGLLGERNNPAHQEYLAQMGGVFIDMVVVNLYPFKEVIAKAGVSFEQARGNIDIGGPTMIRAAAKNFPSCAVVCDPQDYQAVINEIKQNAGCTGFDTRFNLAKKVFAATADYDAAISGFFAELNASAIRSGYKFAEGSD